MMNIAVRTHDRFIAVDGLDIRYLEAGNGVPAILLHGSSLGSSADVFRRNLPALASGGGRPVAGAPALLRHGSSLGSSADVFRRTLPALASGGVRAIAVDLPGFGKSDPAPDLSGAAPNAFILRFTEVLG